MAPDVSTASGWKMKCLPSSAYLAIFLTSAASATDPAASATDPTATATDPTATATDPTSTATDPTATATDPTATATDPAAIAARIMFEDANVLTYVASQMTQRPRE